MSRNYILVYLVLSVFPYLVTACTNERTEKNEHSQLHTTFSIEEAQLFFEIQTENKSTRSANSYRLPFNLDYATSYDWQKAELSSSQSISCVDVPISNTTRYQIIRTRKDGTEYTVEVASKLIIVKSNTTNNLCAFVRVCIPDEPYAQMYGNDICNLTLNCENRLNYSGLEYYTRLNGMPVAIAKYADGTLKAGVFLYDKTLTTEERDSRFSALFNNMWIIPLKKQIGTRSSNEWDYGMPGTAFVDSRGSVYIYVDNDGDGLSDSITQLFVGNSSGGGAPTFDDSPIGSDSGIGVSDGNFNNNMGGGGSGTGGSNGGGSKDGIDADDHTKLMLDSLIIKKLPIIKTPLVPDSTSINPIPLPITPGIFPPDSKPEEDKTLKDKKPCADSVAMEANPLSKMKISDDNASWKSNTWGYVRNRGTKFHDGLDLSGEPGVTPIYAMFEGTVVRVVANQPNRDRLGRFPNAYSGDRDNAGNRVTIESKLHNGSTIQTSYWHLDIAELNSYTQNLKVGDHIYQGQIIGITGNTGNAYNKKTHLHLKTYIVGTNSKTNKINNPIQYLYTKFNKITGTIEKDC